MANNKPISKDYLLTQLKNFDEKVLEEKYVTNDATGADKLALLDGVTGNVQEQLDKRALQICKTIDLSDTTIYSEDTWYPVVGNGMSLYTPMHSICVISSLGYSGIPSWATHERGFTCNMELLVTAHGWGATYGNSICFQHDYKCTVDNICPCSYTQMTNSSQPVLWLRGGGIYDVYTSYKTQWFPQTSAYTVSSQTVEPVKSCPTLGITRPSTITAHLNGAATALRDYSSSDSSKTIQIGFSGVGLSTDTLTHIAGYTDNGTKIKDVGKDVLQSWLGVNSKAPLASPALTGTPTAPTAAASTNNTQLATTAFVQTAVANLVNGAPETMNTLKEVSDAIAAHEDVTDALNAAIGSKANSSDLTAHINDANKHKDTTYILTPASLAFMPTTYQSSVSTFTYQTTELTYNLTDGDGNTVSSISFTPVTSVSVEPATTSKNGLMSYNDKAKLNNTPTISFSSTVPTSVAVGEIVFVYE